MKNKIAVFTGNTNTRACLKLHLKSVVKYFEASAYVVSASGAFKVSTFDNYRDNYTNAIEALDGVIMRADETLSCPRFFDHQQVFGIDAVGLSDQKCRDFIMRLAKALHQQATEEERIILLVLDDIDTLGMGEQLPVNLQRLMAWVSDYFWVALSVKRIEQITNNNITASDFHVIPLKEKKPLTVKVDRTKSAIGDLAAVKHNSDSAKVNNSLALNPFIDSEMITADVSVDASSNQRSAGVVL